MLQSFPGSHSLKSYLVTIALRDKVNYAGFDPIPVLVLACFAYTGEIVQG